MNALRGLAFLLLLQAAGEALTHALALPFPGPVVGLVLLLPALQAAWVREPVAAAADLLLGHLSLLFVPVGVGVITHLTLLSQHGPQLLVAIVASTWIGMAVTALVLRRLMRDDAPRHADPAVAPASAPQTARHESSDAPRQEGHRG
jgi:holin-like protein